MIHIPFFQTFIESNPVAAVLAMHYTNQTAKAKDRVGLMRVLGILSNAVKGNPYEDPFMHNLVSHLITMVDDFEAEDFCTIVFDEFFFTNITHENYVRHLLRLLGFVYPKLNQTRLENLIKLTEPAVNPGALVQDPVVQVHGELKAKIEAHLASVAAAQEDEENKTASLI